MPIEVRKPGLATTVQDRGREGYYHVGVPPSGALDQCSLVAANLLVGNAEGAAGARVRLPWARSCAFDEDAVVAVDRRRASSRASTARRSRRGRRSPCRPATC